MRASIQKFRHGERINTLFSLKQKWLKNNGVNLLLSDSTGEIEGHYYKNDFKQIYENFDENEIIKIDGVMGLRSGMMDYTEKLLMQSLRVQKQSWKTLES